MNNFFSVIVSEQQYAAYPLSGMKQGNTNHTTKIQKWIDAETYETIIPTDHYPILRGNSEFIPAEN